MIYVLKKKFKKKLCNVSENNENINNVHSPSLNRRRPYNGIDIVD